MHIVSFEPYLTDILLYLGLADQLVGITQRCQQPQGDKEISVVTTDRAVTIADVTPEELELLARLSQDRIDLNLLSDLSPELILTAYSSEDPAELQQMQELLRRLIGCDLKLRSFPILTLENMYETFELLGVILSRVEEGRSLAHRIKAQLMDWSDNFYARMKNKKVTVLSSVTPLRVAGKWIPDLVRSASATPQHFVAGKEDLDTTWSEIERFKPDVLIIAPNGFSLDESVKTLRFLERVKEWESIPAVKRGEVIFADGQGLYLPGPRFLKGAAVLFSAIAGLESGYITQRDEFYRLRWVELHRHKFQ